MIFLSLTGLLFVLLVLWPTINALRVRHAVADSLDGAVSVRLDEFTSHISLSSVELPRSEWSQVLAAIPITPDAGVPGSVRACFIPHHRVVFTNRQGQVFPLTVCFACDQAHTKGTGIFATPYLWRNSLRHLFTSHGIRIRIDQEYTDALFDRVPRP